MNILKLNILLFILISNIGFSQVEKRQLFIEWQPNLVEQHKVNSILELRAKNTYTSIDNLPIFNFKIALPEDLNEVNTSISFTVTKQHTLNGTAQIIAMLPDNYSYDYNIYKERNKNYLVGTVIPVVKNGSAALKIASTITLNIGKKTKHSLNSKTDNFDFKAASMLQDGKWIKMAVSESNLFRISFTNLVDLGFTDPLQVAVYGNPTGMLPRMNIATNSDDLNEISSWIDSEFLYFYAYGPTLLEFNTDQQLFERAPHLYSSKAYYYLGDNNNVINRVKLGNSTSQNPTHIISEYDAFHFHENDSLNLINSGRIWLGEHFDATIKKSFPINLPNLVKNQDITLTTKTYCKSTSNLDQNIMSVFLNQDLLLLELSHLPTEDKPTSPYATEQNGQATFQPSTESFTVDYIFSKPSNYAEAWLDYFTLNYRCKLSYDKPFSFRDINTLGSQNLVQYEINNAPENAIIWDVTDPFHVQIKPSNHINGKVVFKAEAAELREYFAFSTNDEIKTPELIGVVENQNLHGLGQIEYLIISANDFLEYANELATFHKSNGLQVAVTTPEKIYNEYSAGMPDISAIRNFIRSVYQNNQSEPSLKYVLLLGDGSYDNRPGHFNSEKFILSYQSANSMVPVQSFVSDDFFGLLDANEGESDGLLDVGIGRLPVRSKQEAQTIINKIKQYAKQSTETEWQQKVVLIADDEDNNIHLDQAEKLALQIEENNSEYLIEKIYIDAFTEETTSFGTTNPDANTAINATINSGALIVNYTGHGGPFGLSTERVINVNDVVAWHNTNKTPVFMTATCEFSQFDDINNTSAGELALLNKQGGGIALFSTTRKVYSTPNFILNQKFYDYVFSDSLTRLGDIMRQTKTASGSGINKRNFTLLGDPALKIKNPSNKVEIIRINGQLLSEFTDTLSKLELVHLDGRIVNKQHEVANDINGILTISIFGQEDLLTTLGNSNNTSANYEQFTNKIGSLQANVEEGTWTCQALIPLDIREEIGKCKFLFYLSALESESNDANGALMGILMGGNNSLVLNDNKGPTINAYLNTTSFISGDIVAGNPILYINLFDSLGINATSVGIGHDITLRIDSGDQLQLNQFYEPELNNFMAGKIKYELNNIAPGQHHLTIQSYDLANNLSEKTLAFEVSNTIAPVIERAFNYPNPFVETTNFYFTQNLSAVEYMVQIKIFTVSGKLVKTINEQVYCDKLLSPPIFWDGLDDFNNQLGRGVYLYELSIKSSQNKKHSILEKLVILQ